MNTNTCSDRLKTIEAIEELRITVAKLFNEQQFDLARMLMKQYENWCAKVCRGNFYKRSVCQFYFVDYKRQNLFEKAIYYLKKCIEYDRVAYGEKSMETCLLLIKLLYFLEEISKQDATKRNPFKAIKNKIEMKCCRRKAIQILDLYYKNSSPILVMNKSF